MFCRLDLVVGVEWCADTDGAGIYRFPPLGPVTDGHMFAVSPRLRTHEAATSATLPNSMGSSAASLVWRSATNNTSTVGLARLLSPKSSLACDNGWRMSEQPKPGTLAYAQMVAERYGDLDDAAVEDGMDPTPDPLLTAQAGGDAPRTECNWPRCQSPRMGKCFAWCKCRCHARSPR